MKRLGDSLGPLIANLERRAQETQDLTARVRTALRGLEQQHFLSASYRDDTLVLTMDSAVWCSRIRYEHERLIETLHAQGETRVTKIKVRVGKARQEQK